MKKSNAIEVKNLIKTYGDVYALNDVDLNISDGEYFVLLGPSGGGKTTLLRSIGGFIRPDSGSVEIKGKNAHAASPHMGVNAIHASCLVIESLYEEFRKKKLVNPLLGKTTFVPSIIQGGRKTNMVADQCKFQIDVRFIPPLTIKRIENLIKKTVSKSCRKFPGTKGFVKSICIDRPPIISNQKSNGCILIRDVIEKNLGIKTQTLGVSYYSDSGVVASSTKNKQCFLLGPGNIEQAHSPNEFVNLKELNKATKIYLDIMEKYLS